MAIALGIDWAAEFALEMGDDLHDVSFVRTTPGSYDVNNPTRPPATTSASYVAKGIAFSYEAQYVDGDQMTRGDYAVMILLGTIAAVLNDAVKASIDLGDETANVDSVLRAVLAGAAGNAITLELVDDAVAAAGTLVELGTNVRIGYLAGSTTVADLEALIADSSLLEVATTGTSATLLDASDAFAATALAGGSDASTPQAPGVIPQIGDSVTCPPPAQTTPKTGTVINIDAVTQAGVTVRVRGPAL